MKDRGKEKQKRKKKGLNKKKEDESVGLKIAFVRASCQLGEL